MTEGYYEPIFAVLLLLASGLALTAHTLGVLLDPTPAIAVSGVLVGLGAAFLVPEGKRAIGAIIGLLSVGLAGVVIPRLIGEFTNIGDEMTVTLLLSGLVLLLTFAVLRLVVFEPRSPQPS